MTAEKAIRKKENLHDFTTGEILPQLLRFMLPILGALILQTLYSLTDVLVVGRFGSKDGISAISTGSSVINLIIFVLNGLAMGVTIMMGRYIGERKQERLGKVIGGAICTFLLIAVVFTALLTIFAPLWADIMQSPAEAKAQAVLYIRICGGGIIFIIGYNLISSIFRGIGNSSYPLLFVGIACIVNVGLDLLFVAGFHWNVAGAASATVISQAVSLILSIIICTRIQLPFSLRWSDIRLGTEAKLFVLSGLPIALQELLTQISFLALLSFINGMGTTAAIRMASSSGYGVANKLVALVMLVPSALMQSMSSFIAQNVGAGKEKRAEKAMGYGMVVGATIGLFMTVACLVGGQALAAIFTPNKFYQLKTAEFLQGYSLEPIVTSVLFSMLGYFSGHGKSFFVMIQGFVQSFIVRLPVAYIMTKRFPDNMIYVGFSVPLATIAGILISVIYYIYLTRKLEYEEE